MIPSLLIIEHDPLLGGTLRAGLGRRFEASLARSAQEAVDLLDRRPFDVILLSLELGGNNGVELLQELRSYEDWMNVPVVALSAVRPELLPLDEAAWRTLNVPVVLHKPEITLERIEACLAGAVL